jgi:hypothetical protein
MDQKTFARVNTWGFVASGTNVVDTAGNRYVVEPQDGEGLLTLRHLSGGKDEVFDVRDPIDQSRFIVAPSSLV